MSYNEISVESLYIDSLGITPMVNDNFMSIESSDNDMDSIFNEVQSAENVLQFLDLYTEVEKKNTSDKIRMLRKIKANYGGNSSQLNRSVENYCSILSMEAEAAEKIEGDAKVDDEKAIKAGMYKKNIFMTILKAIGNFFRSIWEFIVSIGKAIANFVRTKILKQENELNQSDSEEPQNTNPINTDIKEDIVEVGSNWKDKFREKAGKVKQKYNDVFTITSQIDYSEKLKLDSPGTGSTEGIIAFMIIMDNAIGHLGLLVSKRSQNNTTDTGNNKYRAEEEFYKNMERLNIVIDGFTKLYFRGTNKPIPPIAFNKLGLNNHVKSIGGKYTVIDTGPINKNFNYYTNFLTKISNSVNKNDIFKTNSVTFTILNNMFGFKCFTKATKQNKMSAFGYSKNFNKMYENEFIKQGFESKFKTIEQKLNKDLPKTISDSPDDLFGDLYQEHFKTITSGLKIVGMVTKINTKVYNILFDAIKNDF